MEHQTFLDKQLEMKKENFTVVNWNVQNPSIGRAYKQAEFLVKNGYDIIILTEVRDSKACNHLKDRLIHAGYFVIFPKAKDYGVMIASREKITLIKESPFLPSRLQFVKTGKYTVIGIYVPPSAGILKRKKFLETYEQLVTYTKSTIIAGDLNVPYPDDYKKEHKSIPARVYNAFSKYIDAYKSLNEKLEFSLYRRKGYRPDNIFISKDIKAQRCYFLDTKLSDHRMMVLEIMDK